MYKFFEYANEVDSHKKSKQSGLVLKKYWVTQCGCLWLCAEVSMGTTIKGLWKISSYGFKRDHY